MLGIIINCIICLFFSLCFVLDFFSVHGGGQEKSQIKIRYAAAAFTQKCGKRRDSWVLVLGFLSFFLFLGVLRFFNDTRASIFSRFL